jgi:hypothetical protein
MKIKLIFILLLAIFFVQGVLAVQPNGANVNASISQSYTNQTGTSVAAQAGNVTELNIVGFSSTQSWQGYFGNVTGVIQLADSSGRNMYNWSLTYPEGEVYASTNSTINWANVQCFNFTANGSMGSAGETAGETNLAGYNLTGLQRLYNISGDAADSVNNTFAYYGETDGHDSFYTANKEFNKGECPNTRVYDNSGAGVDGNFEEVLLYEPTTTSIIFASLLEKGGLAGFDGKKYDFEMLVLENGHGVDVSATNYYFYVEIQ